MLAEKDLIKKKKQTEHLESMKAFMLNIDRNTILNISLGVCVCGGGVRVRERGRRRERHTDNLYSSLECG